MFHIIYAVLSAAQVAADIQHQQREKENVRRRAMGLPPLPPPQPPLVSEKEQREIDRLERIENFLFWSLVLVIGALPVVLIGTFLYVVMKLAFKVQGIDWP